MNKTSIEWCLNPDGTPGYTWNPITGCLNGCTYCYARKLANGRLKRIYLSGGGRIANQTLGFMPFTPRFWPEKLKEIPRGIKYGRKPRGIFVCNMSDLFGLGVPEVWTRAVLSAIQADPVDRFYLLTKCYDQLAKWSPFPHNCWVGVSAWDIASFVTACQELGELPQETYCYLSLEPLLSWEKCDPNDLLARLIAGNISYLIIGAVTKHPELPAPKPVWIEEIVQAADQAGVKVWLKDSLLDVLKFGPISYPWAFCNGKMRQEMT